MTTFKTKEDVFITEQEKVEMDKFFHTGFLYVDENKLDNKMIDHLLSRDFIEKDIDDDNGREIWIEGDGYDNAQDKLLFQELADSMKYKHIGEIEIEYELPLELLYILSESGQSPSKTDKLWVDVFQVQKLDEDGTFYVIDPNSNSEFTIIPHHIITTEDEITDEMKQDLLNHMDRMVELFNQEKKKKK